MTSRTIDYHRESKDTSIYQYTKVSAGVLEQFPLTGSNQQLVTFKIPAKAMNLHRSYLHFEFVIPAQADAPNGDPRNAAIFKDVLAAIDTISLKTASGAELMNSTQFRMFQKLSKKDIKLEDYLTFEKEEWLAPNRGFTGIAEGKYYCPTQLAPPPAAPQNVVFADQMEPIYVQVAGALGAASRRIIVRFPLGRIRGEIFQCDWSVYFPEILELNINFGPVSKMGFKNNHDNDIGAGEALDTADPYLFSNVHVRLATEQNPAIIQSLLQDVEGDGLRFTYPRTYVTAPTIQGGENQNVSISLTASSGHKLRRVYYTCLMTTDEGTPSHIFDISNGYYNPDTGRWGPRNVQSYDVKLNNTTLNVGGRIDCTQAQDWLANRQHLKGSVIRTTPMYKREWHHQEDFSGFLDNPGDEFEGVAKQNMVGGIPLSNQQTTIEFDTTMASDVARHHYLFAEVEKTIIIRTGSITMDQPSTATPF